MWDSVGEQRLGERQQVPFGNLRAGSRPPFGRVRNDIKLLTGMMIAALAAAIVLPLGARGQKLATPNAGLPAGTMQAKATTACTECHEPRIILQQRLSKAAWGKEVDKMMKWGAVVDPADHDALIDYLGANFSIDKPTYEAPRTLEKSRKTAK